MFKKGIVASAVFPGIQSDIEQFMQVVEKVSASDLFDGFEFFFSGTPEEESRIGSALDQIGLYGVYLPGALMKRDGLDLGAEAMADRMDALEKCKAYVDSAYRMRTRKMLVLSGPCPAALDLDAYLQRFAGTMGLLLDYAQSLAGDYSLEITLEFFNDKGEPYLVIGGGQTVVRLCEALDGKYDNFGITFDTSHVAQLREDLREDYRLMAPYVRHVHFANCVVADPSSSLYGDRHPVFNLEGGVYSDQDMVEFLGWLRGQAHFAQVDILSYEIISRDGMSQEDYYRSICDSARAVGFGR